MFHKVLSMISVLSVAGLLLVGGALASPQEDGSLDFGVGFKSTVLTNGLDSPWEMLWGPDSWLWVSERQGKRITRVNPESGDKMVAGTIEDVHTGPQHEGILGMAFSPDSNDQKARLYVVYTYLKGQDEFERVVSFDYEAQSQKLSNMQTVIEGIPAGNDHNGGRLIFGPDGKLYLSKGELGHNQGGNFCKPIEAQRLPSQEEVKAGDHSAYVGKVLRINPDGSIPQDNPSLNGVVSHVFTYGHRNPQGLVFVGKVLYSSEQGPSSDDEINILESGGNYGWPHVAGFVDDNAYRYNNYSAAPNCESLKFDPNYPPESVPSARETEWTLPENFKAPVMTFYTVRDGHSFNDQRCGDMPYLCWPTIAPGSVTYYPEHGAIPAWRNSLLIGSMKNGVIYRSPLSADGQQPQGFSDVLFHTANRYRVLRVSPDGQTIYIATDSKGAVIGLDGKPTTELANPGAIIKIEYLAK